MHAQLSASWPGQRVAASLSGRMRSQGCWRCPHGHQPPPCTFAHLHSKEVPPHEALRWRSRSACSLSKRRAMRTPWRLFARHRLCIEYALFAPVAHMTRSCGAGSMPRARSSRLSWRQTSRRSQRPRRSATSSSRPSTARSRCAGGRAERAALHASLWALAAACLAVAASLQHSVRFFLRAAGVHAGQSPTLWGQISAWHISPPGDLSHTHMRVCPSERDGRGTRGTENRSTSWAHVLRRAQSERKHRVHRGAERAARPYSPHPLKPPAYFVRPAVRFECWHRLAPTGTTNSQRCAISAVARETQLRVGGRSSGRAASKQLLGEGAYVLQPSWAQPNKTRPLQPGPVPAVAKRRARCAQHGGPCALRLWLRPSMGRCQRRLSGGRPAPPPRRGRCAGARRASASRALSGYYRRCATSTQDDHLGRQA